MPDIEWLHAAAFIITGLIGVGWAIFWFWVRQISVDVKNAATKIELEEAKENHAELFVLVSDLREKTHELRNDVPTRREFSDEKNRNDRNIAEIKSFIKAEGDRTVAIITQRLEDLGVTKRN
jgi:hypothetical protein